MPPTPAKRRPRQQSAATSDRVTPPLPHRFARDGPEFLRIVTLSDGVFAIAMTLLVLGIQLPDVPDVALTVLLRERVPNLIAFGLGFALVANLWWEHHKLVARLAFFEPGTVRLNLLLLGVVALVPFPTGLVGAAPLERAAVVPFITVFCLVLLVFIAMIVRIQRTKAWRSEPGEAMARWVMYGWLAELGGMLLALVAALALPVAGLFVAAIKGYVVGGWLARRAPPGYVDWS